MTAWRTAHTGKAFSTRAGAMSGSHAATTRGIGRCACWIWRRAIRRADAYFTLLIHLRIGPVTVVSAVSGDMTSEMWLWSLDRKSTRLNSSHLGISYAV